MKRLLSILCCLLIVIPVIGAKKPAPNRTRSRGTLALQTTTTHSVALAWTASTSSTTETVTYTVLRGTGTCASSPAFNSLTTGLTGTTFTDSTVTAGTSYAYEVEALNAQGAASSPSNCADATVPLPVPAPPTNLHVVSVQ